VPDIGVLVLLDDVPPLAADACIAVSQAGTGRHAAGATAREYFTVAFGFETDGNSSGFGSMLSARKLTVTQTTFGSELCCRESHVGYRVTPSEY
jgi:hypothetical protein